MADALFELLVRHRDSLLYKLGAQRDGLEQAVSDVARITDALIQTEEDLARASAALDALYGQDEDA